MIGVDVNPNTVDAVNNGDVPFVEPDLGIHVAGAVSRGRLRAQLDTPSADAYIVAVPTPFKADKSGVFPYYCTNFCSALHQEMQGYLRVSAAGSNVPLMANVSPKAKAQMSSTTGGGGGR